MPTSEWLIKMGRALSFFRASNWGFLGACLTGTTGAQLPWAYVLDVRGSGNPTRPPLWGLNSGIRPLALTEVLLVPAGNTWLSEAPPATSRGKRAYAFQSETGSVLESPPAQE